MLFGVHHVYAALAFGLSAFVVGTIVLEYWRGISSRVRHQGERIVQAAWELTMRNKRRFGGYIVHLGMAILFVGIAASSAYQEVGEVRLRLGESFALNGVRMRYEGIRENTTPQYRSAFARLGVYRAGYRIGEVEPEKRLYFTPPQPTTEPGIRRGRAFGYLRRLRRGGPRRHGHVQVHGQPAGELGVGGRRRIHPRLHRLLPAGALGQAKKKAGLEHGDSGGRHRLRGRRSGFYVHYLADHATPGRGRRLAR